MSNYAEFTSKADLARYNELLLKGFVDYLNRRHRGKRDVFGVGVSVQILESEIDGHISFFLENLELESSPAARTPEGLVAKYSALKNELSDTRQALEDALLTKTDAIINQVVE